MPPLILAVIVGAGAYAGLQMAQRIKARLDAAEASAKRGREASAATAGSPVEKDLGALELDPATGVYRPARRH